MPEQQPSIGRIVHYFEESEQREAGECQIRAAVITDVGWGDEPEVKLAVFKPDGIRFVTATAAPEEWFTEPRSTLIGKWAWPKRV